MSSNNSQCPCCSGKSYQTCCAPIHDNPQSAETPEQLMRSRFSAFKQGDADYLLNTLHPSQRSDNYDQQLKMSLRAEHRTEWIWLDIVDSHDREVEFYAYFWDRNSATMTGNKLPSRMHERSRFVFDHSQWYYVDGDQLPIGKMERNALCWCGSKQKAKKCCLA